MQERKEDSDCYESCFESEEDRQKAMQDGLAEWREWIASPEGKAREKLNEKLQDLRSDPDIGASKLCIEFLDLVITLFGEGLLEADAVSEIVTPLAGHFKKVRAKENAAKSHEENHAMKAAVFTWLVDNRAKFKSKEKTASAVEREQPISHRTALKWISEWEKLPPASAVHC